MFGFRRGTSENGPAARGALPAALQRPSVEASIVQLLGDLGDRRLISRLEEFTQSPDPEVASAARESIETLQSGGEAE
jgi:HEAT repeat protein